MNRDEAAAILDMPREQAIEAILELAYKAEQYDKIRGGVSPTCPSGMKPPYLKPNTRKRRKKPGRKQGHPGVARPRPERIDDFKEHTLDRCPDCQAPLSKPIKPYKRYIQDIVPVEPKVTEHTVNGYWCGQCQKIVYPQVSEALPNATIGLRLLVWSAWLHYLTGMSVNNIVRLLSIFANFKISPGGLTQAWKNLAQRLMPVYDQIGQQIKSSAVVNADETGWRLNGVTHWLWCFADHSFCYYTIDRTRGSPVVKRVLGEIFNGILISDFWGAYNKIQKSAAQKCLYHLFTELEKVDKSNSADEWKAFRKKLIRLLKDAVRLWTSKNQLSTEAYNRRKSLIHERLGQIVVESTKDKEVLRLKKRLIKYRDELFTFLDHDGVMPYNNHAEQQMRKPVITRKISQQNRSEQGAITHALFLTLFRTAELQHLNPVESVLAQARMTLDRKSSDQITSDLAA
jgi:hypothetical protein